MTSNKQLPQPDAIEGQKSDIAAAPDENGARSKKLTPAAKRALAEAAERRRQRAADQTTPSKEIGGRRGADPVRYGDWEKGGIAWDF